MDADTKNNFINEIYKNYPRKEGKSDGVKKLAKLLTTPSVGEEILLATKNYRKIVELRKCETKHILLFSTFINGRWEDYVDVSHLVKPTSTIDFV